MLLCTIGLTGIPYLMSSSMLVIETTFVIIVHIIIIGTFMCVMDHLFRISCMMFLKEPWNMKSSSY